MFLTFNYNIVVYHLFGILRLYKVALKQPYTNNMWANLNFSSVFELKMHKF